MGVTDFATTAAVTTTTNADVGSTKNLFQPIDYVIFVILLLASAAIGLFFAIRDRRRKFGNDTSEYLMAGRQMSFGPVTMSLIASFMSSVTILGVPAEYYIYGTMFTWFALVYALVAVIIAYVYMPVFYDLGAHSTYEYLEMRFHRVTRLIVTYMYFVLSLLYGGVVVYGPALALQEVTGFHLWVAILSTGLVCMFYTALGGLKAVIWTDVLQTVVMMSGFFAVIIQGSINHGGFTNIWNAAYEGGRIDFVHFEADPRIRHTFWSILLGGTVFWIGINGVNQAQVQRYVCCKSKSDARKAILLDGVGLIVILVMAGMTGLVIYATYKDCDPLDSNAISKSDQLFPYIVMDILGYLPGVPGIFVAGVYSSSLSTISSGMNAMACVALEDVIKPNTNWRPGTYLTVSKILVVVFGVLYILLAYMASVVGGLIRMAYSILGIIGGPIAGVFTLGMLMPFVNHWGATAGVLCGLASTIWVFVGSLVYPKSAELFGALPRTTEGCSANDAVLISTTSPPNNFTTLGLALANVTTTETAPTDARPPIADFYAMSYIYIALLGFATCIIVGVLISLVTGCTKKNPPNRELLCSFIRSGEDDTNSVLERSASWHAASHHMVQATGDIAEAQPLQEDRIKNIEKQPFSAEKESTF